MDKKTIIMTLADALRDVMATASSIRVNGTEQGENIDDILTEIEQTAARSLTHCDIELFV